MNKTKLINRFAMIALIFMVIMQTFTFLLPTVHATTFLSDDFETGDFSAWTSQTKSTSNQNYSVTDSYANTGSYSALFETKGNESTTQKSFTTYTLGTPQSTVYARGYFYLTKAFPMVDNNDRFTLIQWSLVGANYVGSAQIEYSATLVQNRWVTRMYNGSSVVTAYNATPTPTMGAWFAFEFYMKVAVSGEVKLWIDGTQVIWQKNMNTTRYGNISKVHFGLPYTYYDDNDVGVAVDDCAISDTYNGLLETTTKETYVDDGFETDDFSMWTSTSKTTGANATTGTAYKHRDSYGAMFEIPPTSGTSEIRAMVRKDLATGEQIIYSRGYFYVNTSLINDLIDTNDRIGFILTVGGVGGWTKTSAQIRKSASGIFWAMGAVTNTTTATVAWSTVTPSNQTWYCVELYTKVGVTDGEAKLWIDGALVASASGLNNSRDGNITRIDMGLYGRNEGATNPAIRMQVLGDQFIIQNEYVGTESSVPPPVPPHTWGLVANETINTQLSAIKCFMGNQSITRSQAYPAYLTSLSYIEQGSGLVVWTFETSPSWNITALRRYAYTHPVLIDVADLQMIYPSAFTTSDIHSISTGSTNTTITYLTNWGNFLTNDVNIYCNKTNGIRTIKSTSTFLAWANVTKISRYNTTRFAMIRVQGINASTGFFAVDMQVFRDSSLLNYDYNFIPVFECASDTEVAIGAWGKLINTSTMGELSYTDLMRRFKCLAGNNSSFVTWEKWGTSVQGRDVNATRIGKGTRYMMIDAGIHGNEKNPPSAMLVLAQYIVDQYNAGITTMYDMLQQYTINIIPIINVDGYVGNWRNNANNRNLNRNFNPANLSEPEARAVKNLMGNYTPDAYVTLHEGRYWEPNDMYYDSCETSITPTHKMHQYDFSSASLQYVGLHHFGHYTHPSWGSYRDIADAPYYKSGGHDGSYWLTESYARHQYNAISTLIECVVWHDDVNFKSFLYACDYYCTLSFSWITRVMRDRANSLWAHSNDRFSSFTYSASGQSLVAILNGSDYTGSAIEHFYVTALLGKPHQVKVNGVIVAELTNWNYSSQWITVWGSTTVRMEWNTTTDNAPAILSSGYNTSLYGHPVLMFVKWQDDVGLAKGYWCSNISGSTAREYVTFSTNPAWHNVTKTLPSITCVVNFFFTANDTINQRTFTANFTITVATNVPPTLVSYGITTHLGCAMATWYSYWTDSGGLDHGIFGTNSTGFFFNSTSITLTGSTGWINHTEPLPYSGAIIYKIWCYDTSGLATSTPMVTVNIIPPTPTPSRYPSTYMRTYTSIMLYLRSDTHIVGGTSYYQMNQTNTITSASYTMTVPSGTPIFQWGWRLYLKNRHGALSEWTSGYPVGIVTRNSFGGGLQTSIWMPPECVIDLGTCAVVAEIYVRNNGGSWLLIASFATDLLISRRLENYPVSLQLMTAYSTMAQIYGTLQWGSNSYPCGASIRFMNANEWEMFPYLFAKGDLILAVAYPFTVMIGSLFYSLIFLMITGGIYLRFRSIRAVLVLWILFGGTGGVFNLMVGEYPMMIGWFVLGFALAGLLYTSFR